MGAALDDAGRGDEGELGLVLEFGDAERTAVAHGGLDLEDGLGDVFFQGTRVGDIGVDTLFEGELLVAAQVIALPVAGAVGALAPVLLDVGAADEELLGRALVKAGEVAAQHDEVRAHGQGQGNVVVVDDTAVGADGDVDAGLLEIFVAGLADLDQGGRLTAADALGLAGDADGAAADTDLDEVGAAVRQEAEARSTTLPAPTLTVSP